MLAWVASVQAYPRSGCGYNENWSKSKKKMDETGGGEARERMLACKPLDFENAH